MSSARAVPAARLPRATAALLAAHLVGPRADLPSRPRSVGVPGAFTPPCSSHVPGYVQNEDKFLAKGIKEIYVVAVNDAFCTKAWKKELGAEGSKVHFL